MSAFPKTPHAFGRWLAATGAFLCVTVASTVLALEPPTKDQMVQYRKDATAQKLIDQARAIGNHRVAKRLVVNATNRLRRLVLQKQGRSPAEINQLMEMAPPPARKGMPTTGTVRVLALLIAFNDYPATVPAAIISSSLFGAGAGGFPNESLHNYYDRSSYHQLDIQGEALGWYTTTYNRSSVAMTNAGREALIKEALNHYDAQGFDFSPYDNNGDGEIDYLIVYWTGPAGAWASFWWGYQTTFGDTAYTLDGKRLGTYSWQWESAIPTVPIHETGHALGLPDYYDYDDTVGPRGGVGGLDEMDANWGDHNSFSKYLLGWISPDVYQCEKGTVTLLASGTSPGAAILLPDKEVLGDGFGEYFVVQNRFRTTGSNDVNYPADGLLIWHVDARLDSSGWDFEYDNSFTEHKLLALEQADGLGEIEQGLAANAGDYWTAGKRFAWDTVPTSNLYSGVSSGIGLDSISATGASMTAVEAEICLVRIKFPFLAVACQVVGCDWPFRPWEKYINPADDFRTLVAKGGSRARTASALKRQVVGLTAELSAHPERGAAIEKRAAALVTKLKKLGFDEVGRQTVR